MTRSPRNPVNRVTEKKFSRQQGFFLEVKVNISDSEPDNGAMHGIATALWNIRTEDGVNLKLYPAYARV
jgi:hypothetical protein